MEIIGLVRKAGLWTSKKCPIWHISNNFKILDNHVRNPTTKKKRSSKTKVWKRIEKKVTLLLKYQPSQQTLVPKTSWGRPPPTSPGRPLKILFDRPGDVPIWRPGDVLKWRPGDVLIWRSRDVPGRLIRDVPRTFSGRPLEDLQSTQTWMSQHFFNFSFRTYPINQIYLKAFQHSRCTENPVKL